MPIVTDNYMLSLTQDNRILRVRCSQNDTSRQVKFTIYNNGTLFTIPSGLSVSVHGIKQNGNIFTKSCSYSGSVVTLVLGTQITDIAGISVAELVFTDSSGGKIGTSNFIFQVESDPLLRGTISVTEETPTEYISDLVSMVEALSARVNNIIAPSGEASLSEVVDARLSGYSGTTYQNLKARIDADFAALGNTKADKSNTYTKEEVDDAIDNVTITTDETLSVHGAAADSKKVGDKISEINGSLGNKVDSTPDAQPVIKTGLVSVVNGKIKINDPSDSTTGQYSEPFDCAEGDKFIYFGTSRTAAWGNVYYLDSEDNFDHLENIQGTYPYKIITIPEGCLKVVFQSSYLTSTTDPIPYLYVRKIYDATLSQAIGIGNGTPGQVWTKTASGAKWVTDTLKDAINNGAGFSNDYITYSEPQHFWLQPNSTNSNRLDWNRASTYTSIRTNVIPCESGYAFLMKHNGIVGVTTKQVYFLDGEFDIVSGIFSNSEVFVAPENTKYAIFQSTRNDETTPTLSVKIIRPIVSSTLSGKKVTIIGDSITEGTAAIGALYHTYLAAYCGCTVVNLGVGYTGFYSSTSEKGNYINRISSIPNDTDLIIVCGSFNDILRGGGTPIGTIDDDTNTTLAGCMNQFFTALLTAFPDTAIGIITTGPWGAYHRGVQSSDNYVDMLGQIGIKYGIPFYEIYDRTNLRPWNDTNKATYYGDTGGVHPNTAGHRLMYAALRGFLESLII